MVHSALAVIFGLIAAAFAEDLLFLSTVDRENTDSKEYRISQGVYTVKVVTSAEWKNLTTAEFASYKAIVLPDNGNAWNSDDAFDVLNSTKGTWSKAINGNIIILGTDPHDHPSDILIQNSLSFVTSGNATGLYLPLGDGPGPGSAMELTIQQLSYFGVFNITQAIGCFDSAHIVAKHPAMANLTDTALSGWSCSVHEAFTAYPNTGLSAFQPLAIARDTDVSKGNKTFGDGSFGLPYILSRGATPAGCGDGKWNPDLGEECDDGNTVNGDGCSVSCKCESGNPKEDGTCLPPKVSSSSSASLIPSSTPCPFEQNGPYPKQGSNKQSKYFHSVQHPRHT